VLLCGVVQRGAVDNQPPIIQFLYSATPEIYWLVVVVVVVAAAAAAAASSSRKKKCLPTQQVDQERLVRVRRWKLN